MLGGTLSVLTIAVGMMYSHPVSGLSIAALLGMGLYQIQHKFKITRKNVQQNLTDLINRPNPLHLDADKHVESTFKNLVALALSDKSFDRKENNFIVDWGGKNGITKERMKEIFDQAKNNPQSEPVATGRDDLVFLCCLAMADKKKLIPTNSSLSKHMDALNYLNVFAIGTLPHRQGCSPISLA